MSNINNFNQTRNKSEHSNNMLSNINTNNYYNTHNNSFDLSFIIDDTIHDNKNKNQVQNLNLKHLDFDKFRDLNRLINSHQINSNNYQLIGDQYKCYPEEKKILTQLKQYLNQKFKIVSSKKKYVYKKSPNKISIIQDIQDIHNNQYNKNIKSNQSYEFLNTNISNNNSNTNSRKNIDTISTDKFKYNFLNETIKSIIKKKNIGTGVKETRNTRESKYTNTEPNKMNSGKLSLGNVNKINDINRKSLVNASANGQGNIHTHANVYKIPNLEHKKEIDKEKNSLPLIPLSQHSPRIVGVGGAVVGVGGSILDAGNVGSISLSMKISSNQSPSSQMKNNIKKTEDNNNIGEDIQDVKLYENQKVDNSIQKELKIKKSETNYNYNIHEKPLKLGEKESMSLKSQHKNNSNQTNIGYSINNQNKVIKPNSFLKRYSKYPIKQESKKKPFIPNYIITEPYKHSKFENFVSGAKQELLNSNTNRYNNNNI